MSQPKCAGQTFAAEVTDTKGNTLKCRLSSGQSNSIHGISFNRKEGRNFQKGDQVSVIVTSENPFRIVLAKDFVKPLLIFDMHGVLGEREPFQKGKPRRFIRRPYSQEFIHFCAERFEIAVWSCALKKNIDLKMFTGIKLIFVWTQDESTNLYPYMSIVSEFKPLFLKELSVMWEKFPSYDVSNTILLDNHIEKCERNPLGTCIIVPDFLLDIPDDAVISPHGEIADHLRAMTATSGKQDHGEDEEPGIHLSRYISARAGSCSLFPVSYQSSGARRLDPNYTAPPSAGPEEIEIKESLPVPPTENHTTSFAAVSSQSSSQHSVGETVLDAQSVPERNDKPRKKRNKSTRLLVNVLTSVLGKNDMWIENMFAMHHMPIFPHQRICHEDLVTFASDSDTCVVSDAMVGETVFYVIDSEKKEFHLLFSDLSVVKMSIPADDEEVSDWLDDMSGGRTVLIGELGKSLTGGDYIFFCLDVILLNGIVTCGPPEDGAGKSRADNNLLERMNRVNGWLFSSPLDDVNLLCNGLPVLFKCKEYFPVSQLPHVLSRLVPSSQHKGEVEPAESQRGGVVISSPSLPAYESDGLTFTPIGQTYHNYLAYKWKPAHLCTEDDVPLQGVITSSDLLQACASAEK